MDWKMQKCCTHCPGKLVPRDINDFHNCCQPAYVSGNLRIPSLKKHVSDWPKRRDMLKEPEPLSKTQPSCYEQFAIAKKLHAENLEHQPLPDKVHDSVFKNVRPAGCCCALASGKCDCCCKTEVEDRMKSLRERYGSVLGCKEPKTKMDLAISWETPVDPIYEPSRSTHIDGSEGGLAPAIFSLVQHTSASGTIDRSCIERNEGDSIPRSGGRKSQVQHSTKENKNKDRQGVNCCCDCLCNGLNSLNITRKINEKSRRAYFRNCVACQARRSKEDPRLTRSAVGLALGTEKGDDKHRNLKDEITIPRPKKPFAKRSFCIDTLKPPFSVVNGYRETDYPEHWRLMSVYQQSYRNPYRRRIHRC